MDSAGAIGINLRLDLLQHRDFAFTALRIETLLLHEVGERLLLRNDHHHRVGILVVVQHHLRNELRHLGQTVLETFRRILFTVRRDQQALEAAHYIEEFRIPGTDVAHVACVEPAVDDRVGRCLGILPVAGHHVLAADDDFSLGAVRHLVALFIADLAVHRLDEAARRTEDRVSFRVGTDDRRGLGQAIALEHRHSHSAEEALQLDVQQRAAAHEKAHTPAKTLAYLLEDKLVEEHHQRLAPGHVQAAAIVVFLVVGDGIPDREVEEFLHLRAFGLDAAFDVFLEIAGQCRHGEHGVRPRLPDGRRHVLEGGQRVLADRHEGDAAAVEHHGVHAGHMGEAVVEREDDQQHFVLVE